MKEWIAYSLSDLPHIAKELLNHLGTDIKVVCFEAPMGSGKTTFISALLRSMGIEEIEGSPTYSIVNSYESTFYGEVFHFDLYRLKSVEETLDIGFEEMVYSEAYCFIEWAEKVEHLLPLPYAKVTISVENESRIFTYESISN